MYLENKCGECSYFKECSIMGTIDPSWSKKEQLELLNVLIELPICRKFKKRVYGK